MQVRRGKLIGAVAAVLAAFTAIGTGLSWGAATPTNPLVGEDVTFSANDLNSVICAGDGVRCEWRFSDGNRPGSTVTRDFNANQVGEQTGVLFVISETGGDPPETALENATVTVRAAVPPPLPPPPPPPAFVAPEPVAPEAKATARKLLSPFPRVRVAGRLTRRGAQINLFYVRAPKGAMISARCIKGCRKSRKATRAISRNRDLRVSRLYGNYRAGAVIRVTVTKAGRIGKYTSITIRKAKPPRRVDRCLWPGSKLPRKCPARS